MRLRLLALTALLLAPACTTTTIPLYALRDAKPGSELSASLQNLETAVGLANEFLQGSAAARGFPAENATFSLGHTDILVTYANESVVAMRIETTGWGDYRTMTGDGAHPTDHGFLTGRRRGESATGDDIEDSLFLHLHPIEMAALVLQQAALLREMTARGEFDYWLNYDLLGLGAGWAENNPVDRRALAVGHAFRVWADGL